MYYNEFLFIQNEELDAEKPGKDNYVDRKRVITVWLRNLKKKIQTSPCTTMRTNLASTVNAIKNFVIFINFLCPEKNSERVSFRSDIIK